MSYQQGEPKLTELSGTHGEMLDPKHTAEETGCVRAHSNQGFPALGGESSCALPSRITSLTSKALFLWVKFKETLAKKDSDPLREPAFPVQQLSELAVPSVRKE